MPIVVLRHKAGRDLDELAAKLAQALPDIVAPNLSLPERVRQDGQVTPADIIVWCNEGSRADVNSKDLQIVVFAHDFPERAANLQERTDAMTKGVQGFLINYEGQTPADFDREMSGFVWILLNQTAFGQL